MWYTTKFIVRAIFSSYAYNREYSYMVELCKEVLERMLGYKSTDRTHDGDIIYGFLVILYGDYGTSPRSGWIENEKFFNEITRCLYDLIENYNRLAEEENE